MKLISITGLFVVFAMACAQENVTNKIKSLMLDNESYCYTGGSKFESCRSCRISRIDVLFESAIYSQKDSTLSIHGRTVDEIKMNPSPLPNLQILVGEFHDFIDSAKYHKATVKTRLRFRVDSTAHFNVTFKFYPSESLCFTIAEPVDNSDTSYYELVQAQLYSIGKLIK